VRIVDKEWDIKKRKWMVLIEFDNQEQIDHLLKMEGVFRTLKVIK
jgi:hypothetical protein